MKSKSKVGRPSIPEDERQIKSAVSLPRDLDEFARQLGDGKFSRGVQIALREARKRRKK